MDNVIKINKNATEMDKISKELSTNTFLCAYKKEDGGWCFVSSDLGVEDIAILKMLMNDRIKQLQEEIYSFS